jgi:two-component system response regulator HupR/HoxA
MKLDEAFVHGAPDIIGSSATMRKIRAEILLLAPSAASILITGESGVGKDLVARALHVSGPRAGGPFVAVNCAALSAGILESELFGHARGAFTGAIRAHAGFFEQAHGGTLFLDEIGEMPPGMQAKLLRVLQSRTVRRMGDSVTRSVHVRLVSATNSDLDAAIEAGAFRKDLFYRINVVRIHITPLRTRSEDIADLIAHCYRARRVPVPSLSPAARQRIMQYAWPGNVRELENEIERITTLFGARPVLEAEMLSPRIAGAHPGDRPLDIKMLYDAPLSEAVCELEQDILKKTLMRTNWNKSKTARELGLSRQGLLKKIKRYGLVQRPYIIDGAAGKPD